MNVKKEQPVAKMPKTCFSDRMYPTDQKPESSLSSSPGEFQVSQSPMVTKSSGSATRRQAGLHPSATRPNELPLELLKKVCSELNLKDLLSYSHSVSPEFFKFLRDEKIVIQEPLKLCVDDFWENPKIGKNDEEKLDIFTRAYGFLRGYFDLTLTERAPMTKTGNPSLTKTRVKWTMYRNLVDNSNWMPCLTKVNVSDNDLKKPWAQHMMINYLRSRCRHTNVKLELKYCLSLGLKFLKLLQSEEFHFIQDIQLEINFGAGALNDMKNDAETSGLSMKKVTHVSVAGFGDLYKSDIQTVFPYVKTLDVPVTTFPESGNEELLLRALNRWQLTKLRVKIHSPIDNARYSRVQYLHDSTHPEPRVYQVVPWAGFSPNVRPRKRDYAKMFQDWALLAIHPVKEIKLIFIAGCEDVPTGKSFRYLLRYAKSVSVVSQSVVETVRIKFDYSHPTNLIVIGNEDTNWQNDSLVSVRMEILAVLYPHIKHLEIQEKPRGALLHWDATFIREKGHELMEYLQDAYRFPQLKKITVWKEGLRELGKLNWSTNCCSLKSVIIPVQNDTWEAIDRNDKVILLKISMKSEQSSSVGPIQA